MTLLVTMLTASTAWADVLATTSGTSGACSWTFDTGTGLLTISGPGAMADYDWRWEESPSPFNSCTNIKSVVIGEGVTRIGAKTFVDCSGIETVSIPSTVTSIGDYVFLRCTAITGFTVAAGNTYFASDGGLLYNYGKTSLLNFPLAKTGTVAIPGTVTSLNPSAFSGATGITALDLTACTSLTAISRELCLGCTSLQTVTLPSSVTVINTMAFENCTNLQTINLNDCSALERIGVQAFRNCSNLEGSFSLPATLKGIGTAAFGSCAKLTKVTIADGTVFTDDTDDGYDTNGYGSDTFNGCTSLTLSLPDNMMLAILAAGGFSDNRWRAFVGIFDKLPDTITGFTLSYAGGFVKATFKDDGTPVAIPNDVNVEKLGFDRTMPVDQCATIMLPCADKAGRISGATFYTFTGVSYNSTTGKWEATMTALGYDDELAANTPYLVKASAASISRNYDGSLTLNTTTGTKQTTVGEWSFKGVYEEKTWTAGEVGTDYGFAATGGTATDGVTAVSAGDFVKIGAGAHIKPMRSYLTYTGSGNPWVASAPAMNRAPSELPGSISVVLVEADGSTTTVGTIRMERNAEGWYSLDGLHLDSKPTTKGLYIHNGRKEVVK